MKQFPVPFWIALLILSSISACLGHRNSQITNSFSDSFKGSQIRYSHNNSSMTHDYSGNWDLDGDGILDSVQFIGTGGAHLQYFLSLSLSRHQRRDSFPWIYTDFPLLESFNTLRGRDSLNDIFPKFVVYDFTRDSIKDIYVNVGNPPVPLPPIFSEKGLHTHEVVLYYNPLQQQLLATDYSNLVSP